MTKIKPLTKVAEKAITLLRQGGSLRYSGRTDRYYIRRNEVDDNVPVSNRTVDALFEHKKIGFGEETREGLIFPFIEASNA